MVKAGQIGNLTARNKHKFGAVDTIKIGKDVPLLTSRSENSNQGQQSIISQTKITVSRTRNPASASSTSKTFMNCSTELFHVFVHIEDSFQIVLAGFFWFTIAILYLTQKFLSRSLPAD